MNKSPRNKTNSRMIACMAVFAASPALASIPGVDDPLGGLFGGPETLTGLDSIAAEVDSRFPFLHDSLVGHTDQGPARRVPGPESLTPLLIIDSPATTPGPDSDGRLPNFSDPFAGLEIEGVFGPSPTYAPPVGAGAVPGPASVLLLGVAGVTAGLRRRR